MTKPAVPPDGMCFGGQPQVVLAEAYLAFFPGIGWQKPLYVGGGVLLWGDTGTTTARLDLATLKRSGQFDLELKASDGLEAFGATWTGLIAVDLGTGAQRNVLAVPADQPGDEIVYSHMELDATYVYFVRGPNPFRAPEDSGFFRVRRDGKGQPELLGTEPQRGSSDFLIDGGFAYWTRRSEDERSAIFRRALQAGFAPTFVAHANSSPLAIANGRVYYVDEGAIWSAPVQGGAPVNYVAIGSLGATSAVVDRGCLYWADDRAIVRLGLGAKAPRTPEVVADERTYRGGPIATDGQFLYWLDWRGNRIMRAGRDARSLPPLPTLVAKPVARRIPPERPATAYSVQMGDGWACTTASVLDQNQPQCWEPGPAPAGKLVPWFNSFGLATGADRVCTPLADGSKCWPWPDFARARPDDWATHSYDWEGSVWVGGTFSCARGGRPRRWDEWVWTCSGDNSFGQLAGPGDKTKAGRGLPAGRIAHGTWHGCAIQDPDTTLCWGRGDGGQLGFAPTERCQVEEGAIPCSRKTGKVPFKLPPESRLVAGDMFTCAVSKQGVLCWGASRDGWFGSAAACPARLRKEWPTPTGTVSAPRATCSSRPVLVPGFERVDIYPEQSTVSAGPRGACAMVDGRIRCVGAIATPATEIGNARVSPGARANACGVVTKGKVLCWGEGYSPASDPGAPAIVTLSPALSPDVAVVDFAPFSGTAWPAGYRIHRDCDRATIAIAPCPAGTTGEPWSSLVGKAPTLIGKTVSVRDRLVVGPPENFPCNSGPRRANHHAQADLEARGLNAITRTWYLNGQCYPDERHVVLGEGYDPLSFSDYACIGDESRLCCEAPAYGQTVVATGELARRDRWVLKWPTICQVSGDN